MIIDVIDTFTNRNQEALNTNVEINYSQNVIPLRNYRATENFWSKEYSITQNQLYKTLLKTFMVSQSIFTS